jgi:uncharacterized membrane protein
VARLPSLLVQQSLARVLLVTAITAGALLRFVEINAVGFNSDEAVYAGQAAVIAEVPVLKEIFPVFRAHPLLYQYSLGIVFRVAQAWGLTEYDLLGRLFSALLGLATIVLLYRAGSLLYGPRTGAIGALLLALMPYHVVVTRQTILDGPMTLCSVLTLLLLVRFGRTQLPALLWATGAGLGLTFLAKETGIIFLGSALAFLTLSPRLEVRLRDLAVSLFCMVAMILPFPLSLALAGGGGAEKTGQYLIWQLLRRPNHEWSFYLETVPAELGLLVVAAALSGFWILRGQGSWRERLLVCWIMGPLLFFQFWPVKGFQYLTPIAPAVCLLAARALVRWPEGSSLSGSSRSRLRRFLRPAVIIVVAISLFAPSWARIHDPTVGRHPGGSGGRYLAGSGGVPGGREVGIWIRENVPDGATLMTIGPSMANILQFYGHRRALGLSVSTNPLRRNPSYRPIRNPDRSLRNGDIQYLVWDTYSAGRSPFFSAKLLDYADRYHGRVVFSQPAAASAGHGDGSPGPAIQVIQVRP